jgi:small subunit ribosomal protein S8
MLRIYLKYDEQNNAVIHEITRVSKPGRRVYVGQEAIPRIKNGLGAAILSTSKGVMDDVSAREARIGGEVICSVW